MNDREEESLRRTIDYHKEDLKSYKDDLKERPDLPGREAVEKAIKNREQKINEGLEKLGEIHGSRGESMDRNIMSNIGKSESGKKSAESYNKGYVKGVETRKGGKKRHHRKTKKHTKKSRKHRK